MVVFTLGFFLLSITALGYWWLQEDNNRQTNNLADQVVSVEQQRQGDTGTHPKLASRQTATFSKLSNISDTTIPLGKVARPPITGEPSRLAIVTYVKNFQSFRDALHAAARDATLTESDRKYLDAALRARCNALAIARRIPQTRSVPVGDARNAKNALERRVAAERCEGWSPRDHSDEVIKAAWQAAADAGDVRAKAVLIDYSLRDPKNAESKIKLPDGKEIAIYKGPDLEQTNALLHALSSRDPAFIASYGPMLFETFFDVDFAFGPNSERLDFPASELFWDAVACHFGADCGRNHLSLLEECSSANKCGFDSLEAYIRSVLSEKEIAQFDRLLPLVVTAIESGDWTDVIQRRSPPPQPETTIYTKGHRIFTTLG